jgi:hypothetical protein
MIFNPLNMMLEIALIKLISIFKKKLILHQVQFRFVVNCTKI